MSVQEKFYGFIFASEPEPLNRRVYAAAKLPFEHLWDFLVWVGLPWLYALPVGLAWSALVTYHKASATPAWSQVCVETFENGLVLTLFIGAVFFVLKVIYD